MLTGFLSMVAGITIVLFMREKLWWLRAHRRLGTVAIVCLLLGFMAAVFMVARLTGRHFAVPHAWLGIITILSALGTYTAGLMQFKIKIARVRLLHRWAGRGTFVLMILNIVSGLFLAGIL
ncbi:MAG TPA: hypothetical protein PLA74_00225 [Syntrophales bacterium]|nr:hypothetical protein [Syntrophales bacterium]